MLPTIDNNELVFIEKISVYCKKYTYGDIVVIKYPNEEFCIKRIIGLPGDLIEIQDSMLFINGNKIEEAYVIGEMYDVMDPVLVEENTIFVMGDNRNNSLDSRNLEIGTIQYCNIVGKAHPICYKK